MTASTFAHEFDFETSAHAPEFNLPQRAGRLLWAPMLVMALMAFPIAFLLGLARAAVVADGSDPAAAVALGQFGPAFMFIGFASVFAAISFAIARILGIFRVGGGVVQEAAGRTVLSLKMPRTAKVFMLLMMMGMMAILLAVIGHFAIGVAVLGGDETALANAAGWFDYLAGVRRVGTAAYLLAIAFGLASIIEVLRFQAERISQLPSEAPVQIP